MKLPDHWPPELLEKLVDTIPKLIKSKRGVVDFFRGAAVGTAHLRDVASRVQVSPGSISKHEIARAVLVALNDAGDSALKARREVLKRVCDWEDFSTCWPADELPAKGLVADVRHIVNAKDSFTRMNLEREAERRQRQAAKAKELETLQRRQAALDAVRAELSALFSEPNPQRRGKASEAVLNRLFEASGILVREAFTRVTEGVGVVEQVDGVVEIKGGAYLVEMKWWEKRVGTDEIAPHLVKLFGRAGVGGIYISASGYTDPAVQTCREALRDRVVVLCKLEELVLLLERGLDLAWLLEEKIGAARDEKNPLFEPLEGRTG